MSFDFDKVKIDVPIAGGTSNYYFGTSSRIKDGVIKDSDFKSSTVNTLLYKMSNSIDFIQNNGTISFIKDKKYEINSIVNVAFINDTTGFVQTSQLRCIAVNDQGYCDTMPSDNYTINDAGNIIFNDNNWNNNWWEELPKNGLNEFNLEIDDFEFNYNSNVFSRDDSQVKTIELFDFSNVDPSDFKYLNFSISINRYNNIFMNCVVSGNSSKIKLEVQTVNNNVNSYMVNASNIWYSNSIFKDIAYDGMLFSVDEVNMKVYLHYLGAEVKNKNTFNVNIKINKGSVDLLLNKINLVNFIYNKNYVLVPFIKGANNEFSNSSYKLYDYAYQLSPKEMFKNGLYMINGETTLDDWLYPIARKLKYVNFKIYDLNQKYKLTNSGQERYKEAIFPVFLGKAEGGYVSSATIEGCFVKTSESTHECKVMYFAAGTKPNMYRLGTDSSGTKYNILPANNQLKYIYKTIDASTGQPTNWTLYTGILETSDLFNSKLDEPDRLTTASIKTFPYIKVW